MNIFYLSNNQKECAIFHNNKHTVKMILEYAQLLSTAHRILDGNQIVGKSASGRNKKIWQHPDSNMDSALYSATHINHPSAVWVRQSSNNYNWLSKMLVELCNEYSYRYGKTHKTERDGVVDLLLNTPANIPTKPFTEPTPAMPDNYKVVGDSIQSYKNYYIGSKQHLADWKLRNDPEWFVRQV